MTVSPAKTAESVEVPFEVYTGGAEGTIIRWGQNPPWDGALLSRPTWTCLAVYILRLTRRAAARGDVVCMPLLPWPLVDFDVHRYLYCCIRC